MKHTIILLIVLTVSLSSCIQQNSTHERMPVEIQVVTEPVWSNFNRYPRQYGFISGQEFHLTITATKYTKTDGLMEIEVELPEGVELIDGSKIWQGNDVTKDLPLVLKAEPGRYELEVKATNKDTAFSTESKLALCIGNNVTEITSYCVQEQNTMDSPQQVSE